MKIAFILMGVFLLGILIGFFFSRLSVQSNVIREFDYTYTRAVCNNGLCIDVEITCSDGKVREIKPVSKLIEIENPLPGIEEENFCS